MNPMKLDKIKALMADGAKMLFISLGVGALISLILFVSGRLLGGSLISGLELAKDALFFISSIFLFLLAGMLMIKGKKLEKESLPESWKRHFKMIGMKTAIAIFCVVLLGLGSLIDYVMIAFSSFLS